jgi:hypothetical protein
MVSGQSQMSDGAITGFKINKPTKLQPYLIETRNEFVDIE